VGIRVIDSDGHITEDTAAIMRYMPDYHDGPTPVPRLFAALDHLHMPIGKTVPGAFEAVNADKWLRFLDTVGIDWTVLYPTSGLGYGRTTNIDWAIWTACAYNDWLYEAYLSRSDRLRGMALIPLQEPDAAIEELRRAVAELGMVGGVLPSNGLPQQLGAKAYWPVYAEAERLGCVLSVHGGVHSGYGMDDMNLWCVAHALGHPHGQSIALGSMVFNGVFDRFPGLRVAYLEGGVAWLLQALERFTGSYEAFTPDDPRGVYVRLEPGESIKEYIIRQIRDGRIYIGCEGSEEILPYAIKIVGREPFLFSSDYPHEVDERSCRQEINEVLDNSALIEADQEAILGGNATRFYGRRGASIRAV
jgi:predicted TIM-barrel fold metal-dependent hydrolase